MSLRLSICSDANSWIHAYLAPLVTGWQADGHSVIVVSQAKDIPVGDCCFCLSLGQILKPDVLARNRHNLVVHESALPEGRGWSPVTWQVLAGLDRIPVCLFEASEAVDRGPVYLRDTMSLNGTELVDEIRSEQARVTVALCQAFIADIENVVAAGALPTGDGSWYPRRRPADSQLDPNLSLAEQFNLMRVVDNQRYPAWFEYRGRRYRLRIDVEET